MPTQVSSEHRLHQQNITPSQVQTLRRLELHYNISYQAIICIPCGFALKTDDDSIGRHLKEKYSISKKHRQKLNTLVNSLHLPDPDELPKRADGFVQHLYLAIQTGAECKHCALRSVSYDILSRHLKKVHTQEINGIGTRGKRWLRNVSIEGPSLHAHDSTASSIRYFYGMGGLKIEDWDSGAMIQDVFAKVLTDLGLQNTYLIVGALDEFLTDLDVLLKFIVISASSPVRWIVRSRNKDKIKEAFSNADGKLLLSLDQ